MQNQIKTEYWVTAAAVMRLTGWDKKEMARQRSLNPSIWRPNDTGGYQYNVNAIPELLFLANAKNLKP